MANRPVVASLRVGGESLRGDSEFCILTVGDGYTKTYM